MVTLKYLNVESIGWHLAYFKKKKKGMFLLTSTLNYESKWIGSHCNVEICCHICARAAPVSVFSGLTQLLLSTTNSDLSFFWSAFSKKLPCAYIL